MVADLPPGGLYHWGDNKKEYKAHKAEAYYSYARLQKLKKETKEAKKYSKKAMWTYRYSTWKKLKIFRQLSQQEKDKISSCRFLYGMTKFDSRKKKRGKFKMRRALRNSHTLQSDVGRRRKMVEIYRLHDFVPNYSNTN